MERHHTVHTPNNLHSNPHDHIINWIAPRYGKPNLENALNYWDGNVPEFKSYSESETMKSIFLENTPEENRFKTISDFKECIIRGGEVTFVWNNTRYGVFKINEKYYIALADGKHEKWCNTPDEVLEYMVSDDRLRDVITQVAVLERTI